MALAVLAFRRVNLGRIGLAVSAGVTALVGVVTIVGLVNAAAAIACVVLLFTGGANAWYAGRDPAPRPGNEPPPPPGSGQPPVW